MLYNNLAEDLGRAEGPRARLELARLGAAFTQRRGIAEWVQPLGGLTARALADLGRIDEARALITKLLSDADTAEDRMYQLYLRAADARLSARRGELSRAGPVEWVEQAVKKAREFGEPQWLTTLLCLLQWPGPVLRAALSRCSPNSNKYATSGTPRSTCQAFPTSCASLSRRASRALAERFAAGLAPVHPLDQHALVTARAQLAEYREEHYEVATLYADAERRWKQFEMPWERAMRCWDTAAACSHSAARPGPERPSTRRERSSPASAPPPPSPKPTSAWPGRPR